MQRREFITVPGGVVVWPAMVRAQSSNDRVAHIAYLGATSPSALDPRQIEQFKRGLAENGLIEGRNVTVDYLWAEGSLDRLQHLAGELAGRNLDVIVTAGGQAVGALIAADVKTPIVFAFVNDPIGLHFAASLNWPGGNLTGLSNFNVAIAAKRVELLREAFPDLHRLKIRQNSPAVNDLIELAEYKRAANLYGMEVLTIDARNPGEYEAAAAQSNQWKADGLCITSNPPAFNNRRIIIEIAARLGKPTIYWNTIFVEDGGLISYAVNFQDLARRAAIYAAKILRGAAPGELPIEQPTKFELAINQRTAKTLGIVFPQSILLRADQVIE